MTRLVRDFVELPNHSSLDEMIDTLVALRQTLPAGSEAVLRMQGDDVFGRRLSIAFLRQQTPEEAACDARYAAAHDRPVELAALTSDFGSLNDPGQPVLSLAA